MKSLIKSLIRKITPSFIITEILKNANLSYSQEGEDILLEKILGDKKTGFFVDIGAHHPMRFSNTYKLYKKGWRGINIDAMPNSMLPFIKHRPEDINLEIGVAQNEGILKYYSFSVPALNTFSKEEADGYLSNNRTLLEELDIKVLPLKIILDNHLEKKTMIDFMSIDVEGFETEVLASNDWEKYKPKIILIEDLNRLVSIDKRGVYLNLEKKGYQLISVMFNTLIYQLEEE